MITWAMSSNRRWVETTLMVGTKGKLVMEPFPVVKKIMLQPDATYQRKEETSHTRFGTMSG